MSLDCLEGANAGNNLRKVAKSLQPSALLEQLGGLRRRREKDEDLEATLVLAARHEGITWEEIAVRLGRTRSAVWKKHHVHAG